MSAIEVTDMKSAAKADTKESYIVNLFSSHLPEYSVEIVTLNNLKKYEHIFYENVDYYMITDGHAATEQDVIDTVEYSSDAVSLGFFVDAQSIAFLSFFTDYPDRNGAYIGLFLMSNTYKSKGIGTKIIAALQTIVRKLKYNSIQLSVQDNNISGYRFWQKQGFYAVKETQCDGFRNLSMEKKL